VASSMIRTLKVGVIHCILDRAGRAISMFKSCFSVTSISTSGPLARSFNSLLWTGMVDPLPLNDRTEEIISSVAMYYSLWP